MPDDDAPSDAAIEGQLHQARQAPRTLKGHVMRISPTSSSIDCTTPASMLHRLRYMIVDTTLTTHGGVLSLFGSKIIVGGDASREDGSFLNDLAELRKQAGYGYGTIDEDVDYLLTRTRHFVSKMESLCSVTE
ncbi:hypothetical protein [Salinigranum halophilum]|uniref:hypothetical protein n=1 Tax=Salinigranum halophilum TaxID=2565931 RepID=UPI00191BDBEB|nr:hypothetical protein [Salinigranum halophilum]